MHPPLAAEHTPSTAPTADTAVFLHGLGGWTHNWAALIALLRDSVHCLALDLPGHGRSAPPADGITVRHQAEAVADHLTRTGHRRVHLVGNSLGGLTALHLAAQRPEAVATLTLLAPVLPALPPPQAARAALLALPGAPRLYARLLAARSPDRQLDDLYRLIYADPRRVRPEQRAAEARERLRRSVLPHAPRMLPEGMRAVVRSSLHRGAASPWRQAGRITAPTLLVYGREDRLVPFRLAPRAYAAFRDARLLTLPDTGHVAMQEHPAAVAAAFRALLADADRAARPVATPGDRAVPPVPARSTGPGRPVRVPPG
ncbi:alpha/beta hydrolase [Kitasatospora sp. NPDC089797]|uniref:alpha/beta fold hydrolase n=1 Tax=Kitasatospora sp. NPDC089797 TaxID=3155298 RepID=UPI00343483ED